MPTTKIELAGSTRSKKKYSQAEIIEALKILDREGINYEQTSRITGISPSTIKSWANNEKYQSILTDRERLKSIRKAEIRVREKEKDLIDRYFDRKKEIVELSYKRIVELIPRCNNIEHLLKCIEAFNGNNGNNENPSNTMSIVRETIERLTVISPDNK